MKSYNLFLLTDLYELTMAQGYYFFKNNFDAVFEMTFRRTPFNNGYIIFAGLQPLIEYILEYRPQKEDIEYLSSLGIFKEDFLKYLLNFRFSGDIYSVEEGEIVFPKLPVIRVEAPILQAQILESIILNVINFQSLIATKTARIVESAKGRAVLEFGLRRAQGIDGAISASRAAYIGGVVGTSNVFAGKLYGIPVKGTMAHSWVMSYNSEYESFSKFAELYPNNTILLVDTYNTKDGLKNAIKVFKKLKSKGIKNFGIRIDSGDLETFSRYARKLLDEAGFKDAKIVVSNELDEYIIEQLINRAAPIDIFGVGTKLVTGNPDAALSGVYKIVAKKINNRFYPVIKISDSPEKISLPWIKNVTRFCSQKKFLMDVIHLEGETVNQDDFFYHPDFHYPIARIETNSLCEKKTLLVPIVKKGKVVYKFPSIEEIRQKVIDNLKERLNPEYKRLINPHIYPVGISSKLKKLKEEYIKKTRT